MAVLKKVLLVLLLLVVGVLLFALTKPDRFSVQRRIVVQAPAERIQPLLSDFHQWPRWSPWEKLDPAMQRTFTGPASGVDAAYAWRGNDKVGAGRMQVLAEAPGRVSIQLDFIEPISGHNTTEFSLQPQGSATEVVWTMQGPVPYITKLITVFVSMDAMIGPDFEKGLAQLKTAAEAR